MMTEMLSLRLPKLEFDTKDQVLSQYVLSMKPLYKITDRQTVGRRTSKPRYGGEAAPL